MTFSRRKKASATQAPSWLRADLEFLELKRARLLSIRAEVALCEQELSAAVGRGGEHAGLDVRLQAIFGMCLNITFWCLQA